MNEYRASKLRFIEDKITANIIYIVFLFIIPIIALYFSLQTRDEVLMHQPIYSYSQPVNIRTVRIEKSLSV